MFFRFLNSTHFHLSQSELFFQPFPHGTLHYRSLLFLGLKDGTLQFVQILTIELLFLQQNTLSIGLMPLLFDSDSLLSLHVEVCLIRFHSTLLSDSLLIYFTVTEMFHFTAFFINNFSWETPIYTAESWIGFFEISYVPYKSVKLSVRNLVVCFFCQLAFAHSAP